MSLILYLLFFVTLPLHTNTNSSHLFIQGSAFSKFCHQLKKAVKREIYV